MTITEKQLEKAVIEYFLLTSHLMGLLTKIKNNYPYIFEECISVQDILLIQEIIERGDLRK